MTLIRGRGEPPSHGYRFWFRRRLYERVGYPTKPAARTAETVRRAELGAHRPQDMTATGAPPDVTLAAYVTEWLGRLADDVRGGSLAPKTVQSYRENLDRHVLPRLGAYRLRELGRAEVLDLLAEKRKAGLSKNTVRLIRAALSVLCSDALDQGLIATHPALRVGRRRRGERMTAEDRVQAIRPMSREQRDTFLTAGWKWPLTRSTAEAGSPGLTVDEPHTVSSSGRGASATRATLSRAKNGTVRESAYPLLFELLAKTGLRPEEAFGLRVGDVDLARRVLHVERALADGVERPTKTYERRTVDLTDGLVARLRLVVDGRKPAAPLLENTAGTPLDRWRMGRVFRAVLKRAGLPHFRPYDLRHTFASLRLSEGAPPLYVAQQLGHRDAITTLRNYARWIPSGTREWVEQDGDRSPGAGATRAAPARPRRRK